MNCPYCSRTMNEGYIYSSRTLSWTPHPMNTFREAEFQKEGNVVLSETGLLSPAKVTAFCCPDCRRVIIPY